MDPVTTALVAAFVAGGTAGLAKTGEKMVGDAYAALKQLVVAGYGSAARLLTSIADVEEKPDSAGRRALLAEELESAGALDDPDMIAAAEQVLQAAEGFMPSIGVDWQDVKAARLSIGKIRARAGAIGFRAARMEVTGEVTIEEIDVGGLSGNPTR